jgi:hypothetical protein
MASTLEYRPCFMAGITFLTPMSAVLRIPQRIFLDMLAMIKAGSAIGG